MKCRTVAMFFCFYLGNTEFGHLSRTHNSIDIGFSRQYSLFETYLDVLNEISDNRMSLSLYDQVTVLDYLDFEVRRRLCEGVESKTWRS